MEKNWGGSESLHLRPDSCGKHTQDTFQLGHVDLLVNPQSFHLVKHLESA
jgi:hypothetical protein